MVINLPRPRTIAWIFFFAAALSFGGCLSSSLRDLQAAQQRPLTARLP